MGYTSSDDMFQNRFGRLDWPQLYNSFQLDKAQPLLVQGLFGTPWGGTQAHATQFYAATERGAENGVDLVMRDAGQDRPREIGSSLTSN